MNKRQKRGMERLRAIAASAPDSESSMKMQKSSDPRKFCDLGPLDLGAIGADLNDAMLDDFCEVASCTVMKNAEAMFYELRRLYAEVESHRAAASIFAQDAKDWKERAAKRASMLQISRAMDAARYGCEEVSMEFMECFWERLKAEMEGNPED